MFKKIAFAVVFIFLLLVGAVLLFAKDVEILVSEKESQTTISNYLLRGKTRSNGIYVTPNSAIIDFTADNRAEVTGDLDIEGLGYSGTFNGIFAAGVNYNFPKLYLNNLELIEGGFTTDEETQAELDTMKKAATDFLQRQRERRKVNDSGEPLDLSESKSEDIIEGFARNASVYTLERIPIYDISSIQKGGLAASLALKDVKFTEDAAIVTLSPVTALLRILSGIGFASLFLAWCWMKMGFPLPKQRNPKD